jgi:sporulation protein YlmC with PRC-barrel domain
MNSPDNTFPDAPRPRGRLLDARLHLLDRQLLDDRGVPVGIVDDLELSADAFGDIAAGVRSPRLVGLVSGHVTATRIFGGKPPPSQLQMIPWRLVAAIGTVVRLHRTEMSFDALWVEHWLCDHVVARIPGGRHAAE